MTADIKATPATAAARGRYAPVRAHRRRPHWAHAVLAPLAVLWLIPLVMVVGLSLLPTSNPGTTALGLIPQEPSLGNYVQIWTNNPILRNLVNSLLITVPSVLLVILFGSMTAFALARLRVPLKAVIFGALTLALILPMSSIVVATFKILQAMGLYNDLAGLVLVYTALGLPFAVIIIRTSFLAVPNELYEAAMLDGANKFSVYWKIYLPLSRPALAVVAIWQSMSSWNDFLLPLVTLEDNKLKPLTLIPLAYRGTFLSQPGALFAILVLISIPIVVVFLLVQRHLVNGLSGAIK
ncbi:carbohydrate ABC transporter permease [Micromonospora sp. B11E3]|uniref:carbohydrate ABC transporter permease n=1 Tax=Micromonospora sp. B11E3 TaxID=3153562 RepID=UPI00325E9AF8